VVDEVVGFLAIVVPAPHLTLLSGHDKESCLF
jgi:hypothetical protein